MDKSKLRIRRSKQNKCAGCGNKLSDRQQMKHWLCQACELTHPNRGMINEELEKYWLHKVEEDDDNE